MVKLKTMNTDLKHKRVDQFLHDKEEAAGQAREAKDYKRYERLMERVRKSKLALLEEKIDPAKIFVAQLPEDILGKEEQGVITIDEVVFQDYETLCRTLAHEKLHLEDIASDGLIEIIITSTRGGTPFYQEEVEKVQKVVDIVGLDIVKHLYKRKNYTELFHRFRDLATKKGMEKEKIYQAFFDAFRELKFENNRK